MVYTAYTDGIHAIYQIRMGRLKCRIWHIFKHKYIFHSVIYYFPVITMTCKHLLDVSLLFWHKRPFATQIFIITTLVAKICSKHLTNRSKVPFHYIIITTSKTVCYPYRLNRLIQFALFALKSLRKHT